MSISQVPPPPVVLSSATSGTGRTSSDWHPTRAFRRSLHRSISHKLRTPVRTSDRSDLSEGPSTSPTPTPTGNKVGHEWDSPGVTVPTVGEESRDGPRATERETVGRGTQTSTLGPGNGDHTRPTEPTPEMGSVSRSGHVGRLGEEGPSVDDSLTERVGGLVKGQRSHPVGPSLSKDTSLWGKWLTIVLRQGGEPRCGCLGRDLTPKADLRSNGTLTPKREQVVRDVPRPPRLGKDRVSTVTLTTLKQLSVSGTGVTVCVYMWVSVY